MVTDCDYSQDMVQVNISEFKAVCLKMLEQVRQTGEPIEILKNGEPLAIVSPVYPMSRKAAFGAMKSTLPEDVDEDLITPFPASDWEVLRR